MKNSDGFTLVELLAVIVIMGILMMVAIPSVTRTIENSRKDTFVDIAKSYGNAARNLWTTDNLTCNGTVSSAVDDGDYYILINSKETAKDSLPTLVDQGGKSSWGNRDVNGYVRVNVSTTTGVDSNNDGTYEVEPRRVTKFYVALSDGTHGLIDDNALMMDELKRGNVIMKMTEEQLKKTELTVDDGRLDCARAANGAYSCTAVRPIKQITGVCVDDQTNVGVTGRVEMLGESFATDDWDIIVAAINSGIHPYQIGDTKQIDMGSFGTHTVRLANLSTSSECSNSDFSQTACGTVIEFITGITTYKMNNSSTNEGGWPASDVRTYINNNIYNEMPIDLKNFIINTKAVSGYGARENSNFISIDNLYLLSPKEVWGSGEIYDTAQNNSRQLDYYNYLGVTTSNCSEVIKQYNGSNSRWWLRSSFPSTTHMFNSVFKDGGWTDFAAHNSTAIMPAFRIG